MPKTYRDLLNTLQEMEHNHPEMMCQEIWGLHDKDIFHFEEFKITVREATNFYLEKQKLAKLEIELDFPGETGR